ncbi:unnamed protein product, partial [Timema podura]|nr:unnamed protein product [Timema podura]
MPNQNVAICLCLPKNGLIPPKQAGSDWMTGRIGIGPFPFFCQDVTSFGFLVGGGHGVDSIEVEGELTEGEDAEKGDSEGVDTSDFLSEADEIPLFTIRSFFPPDPTLKKAISVGITAKLATLDWTFLPAKSTCAVCRVWKGGHDTPDFDFAHFPREIKEIKDFPFEGEKEGCE